MLLTCDVLQRALLAFLSSPPLKLAMVGGVKARRLSSLSLVKLSIGKEVPRLLSGFCLLC